MCTGCITTTYYYYIIGSKIYISVCSICTNSSIFSYFLLQQFLWIINAAHMLHESTFPEQCCPSPGLKQDTNLHQPTELCYTNEHVDIIIDHHITLSKIQSSTEFITLLRARQKSMQSITLL